jgi:hypothetical protein
MRHPAINTMDCYVERELHDIQSELQAASTQIILTMDKQMLAFRAWFATLSHPTQPSALDDDDDTSVRMPQMLESTYNSIQSHRKTDSLGSEYHHTTVQMPRRIEIHLRFHPVPSQDRLP